MKTHLLLSWLVVGVMAAVPCTAQMSIADPFGPRLGEPPEIEVTPRLARAGDAVSATIRGYAPTCICEVNSVDQRVEGRDVYIELNWICAEVMCFAATPFEYTISLGTFDPGTYTVHYGGATATFMVMPGLAQPTPPTLPDTDPADSIEEMKQRMQDRLNNPAGSALELPGVEIEHVLWSDVTGIEEGISKLTIDPENPTPSDVVSVTVAGWKPASNLVVGNATVRIEGQTIWLDLYWQEQVQPPTPQPGESTDLVQGYACQSFTVTQYDLTPPYEGVPYEYTKSLGTFAAGMYTLNVANHDRVSGSKSTSFTVKSATSQGLPWPAWVNDFLSR